MRFIHLPLLGLLAACLILVVTVPSAAQATTPLTSEGAKVSEGTRFSLAQVRQRAAELASQPFQADRPELPDFLKGLDYDGYLDTIRFRQGVGREDCYDEFKSLWHDEHLPFQVQFFPRGYLHNDRVTINLIEDGRVRPFLFNSDFFDIDLNKAPADLPSDIGYAGFRLLYPLEREDCYDEFIVFLGASYFRVKGPMQHYGLSARGLAIDTALPVEEEFPLFREFWLVRSEKDAKNMSVYALLDSPRAAGAYRFVIRPGLHTIVEVKAHLFLRAPVGKLGIAPLSSMYYRGKTTERHIDDFRPEVHDSDGLLVLTGEGGRIWRPLANPHEAHVTTFETADLRGFGLFQRERDFARYQDLTAHYHRRPSVWVEPIGEWGRGRVELFEFPTAREYNDNVVALWVPEKEPAAGQEWEFAYRLRFAFDPDGVVSTGRTLSTWTGAGGPTLSSDIRKFVIDFGGPSLAGLPDDTPVEAVVMASSGRLGKALVQFNPITQGRRVYFDLTPGGAGPIDLRCFLRSGAERLTETWSFRWKRD